jgi:uncharacterized protein (UPF0128 family)
MEPVERLVLLIKDAGLPEFEREVRFHPTRRWKFDLCLEPQKLAIEVQGMVYQQGRHTRGKGYTEDCRKLNEAQIFGYMVLWLTPEMIDNGEAIDLISRAISIF